MKAAVFLALLFVPAWAEDPLPQIERLKSSPVLRHLVPNPVPAEAKGAGVDTLRQMYVPPGFQVDLIAAEPDVVQPIAFCFDERGRIWVVEAHSYPQKQPEGQGKDRVLIFADNDSDGQFETRKVFVEGLNLASAIEIGYGGVWIGAAPELLFIPDENRDDVPDGPAKVLLDGFGYQDTHECLNSFLWGPDGWLYGNQGVFNFSKIGKPGAPDSERTEMRAGVWRYHPTRHEFEVFAHGGSNAWGLDYDEHGQFFTTHCRSYFGGGCTTHVIQGGHYWNQTNSHHAPFIIANPPKEYPEWRNYLLASARYDHGAGGAGKPGSDAIYGGHSHCGTLIYQGQNWPAEYRGHLFTINLGGHQINQQVNRRVGSGYDTVHQGRDMFFCTDPKFVGVDLQTGPDGAVYFIDWHDTQHCHNPNTERWDRSNGRIYRMKYEGWEPSPNYNLNTMDDVDLVLAVRSGDKYPTWKNRAALRLLAERASKKVIDAVALTHAEEDLSVLGQSYSLRQVWVRHAIHGNHVQYFDFRGWHGADEIVKSWVLRLASPKHVMGMLELDTEDGLTIADADSPQFRLQVASCLARADREAAWQAAEALAQHGEDATDQNIPYVLWQGIAPLVPQNLDRAFRLAEKTLIPQLADWIHWYAASLGGDGLNRVVTKLGSTHGEDQRRLLACIALAMKTQAKMPMPAGWSAVAKNLYTSQDPRVVRQAEELAAAFGDGSMFPKLRSVLADAKAKSDDRLHAFAVLSRAQDKESLPTFLRLLAEPPFRGGTINLLAKFDAPEIAPALLQGFESYSANDQAAALNTLTSRPNFALTLLDAVAAKTFKRGFFRGFSGRLGVLD